MKHGWVLQEENTDKIVTNGCNLSKTLRKAMVFETRKQARKTGYKLPGDIVRKVELTTTGKAKRFIPGR